VPTARVQSRRHRRQGRGKFRLRVPAWVDPYPAVEGTDPEKRIFAALIQRRIYFVYHGGSPPLAHKILPGEQDHDVDFLLPEYRVIIDPFDPYGHSQPESVTRDARKRALFAAAGYVTYYMWVVAPGVFVLDEGQPLQATYKHGHYKGMHKTPAPPHGTYYGALNLLANLPLLNQPPRYKLTDPQDVLAKQRFGYRIGSHYGTGANAVAAANHARARPPKISIQTGARRYVRSSGRKAGL
jgi:hypothetical protein